MTLEQRRAGKARFRELSVNTSPITATAPSDSSDPNDDIRPEIVALFQWLWRGFGYGFGEDVDGRLVRLS